MNNGIVITSPGEFQEVINELEASLNALSNIFSRETKNAERINQTEIWSGDASKALYDKYTMLNKNYAQIEYSIDLYIKFLKKTLEDYLRLIQEQEKNIDAMANSLDVNS